MRFSASKVYATCRGKCQTQKYNADNRLLESETMTKQNQNGPLDSGDSLNIYAENLENDKK